MHHMRSLYINSSSMEHRFNVKMKNFAGKKVMFLGHKESHMDLAGIEPTSAWWQTTSMRHNLLGVCVFVDIKEFISRTYPYNEHRITDTAQK